ncbi:uncharacterized protein PGTG_09855 [Puccinia graminis f. sp. tritici CRL 75-36-700-3]|uniref:Uncharacterized protein n=1 Tax=Puccinia graminis f. sp. tritici (strain CRL 75-36-700-3 / race SCCL) TaxID=418459 RepID=E3KF60_PUCGT|nr:uncharacterized protein PGTG_09855 [Puccinia graminis f. sp. tritici CRL 75-36-700-3]EFP82887.1 hypothetical protein PGTG_09855 [Puccinia graminis f. sp. tritici CRL 75-36-700-3]
MYMPLHVIMHKFFSQIRWAHHLAPQGLNKLMLQINQRLGEISDATSAAAATVSVHKDIWRSGESMQRLFQQRATCVRHDRHVGSVMGKHFGAAATAWVIDRVANASEQPTWCEGQR